MVPRKLKAWERVYTDKLEALKAKEQEAKDGRRGMWEYGGKQHFFIIAPRRSDITDNMKLYRSHRGLKPSSFALPSSLYSEVTCRELFDLLSFCILFLFVEKEHH